jgi:hypothetical protein
LKASPDAYVAPLVYAFYLGRLDAVGLSPEQIQSKMEAAALMFWFPQSDNMNWGAGLHGSQVYLHRDSPDPITTFIISVSKWSDGTAGPTE